LWLQHLNGYRENWQRVSFDQLDGSDLRLPGNAYPKEISPVAADAEVQLQFRSEHPPYVQGNYAAVLQPELLFFE
jgi:hypothetical protein